MGRRGRCVESMGLGVRLHDAAATFDFLCCQENVFESPGFCA